MSPATVYRDNRCGIDGVRLGAHREARRRRALLFEEECNVCFDNLRKRVNDALTVLWHGPARLKIAGMHPRRDRATTIACFDGAEHEGVQARLSHGVRTVDTPRDFGDGGACRK
jgi:hypothetical protein